MSRHTSVQVDYHRHYARNCKPARALRCLYSAVYRCHSSLSPLGRVPYLFILQWLGWLGLACTAKTDRDAASRHPRLHTRSETLLETSTGKHSNSSRSCVTTNKACMPSSSQGINPLPVGENAIHLYAQECYTSKNASSHWRAVSQQTLHPRRVCLDGHKQLLKETALQASAQIQICATTACRQTCLWLPPGRTSCVAQTSSKKAWTSSARPLSLRALSRKTKLGDDAFGL